MKPDSPFAVFVDVVALAALAAPGIAAFVGAWFWARRGGLIGLFVGYFTPLIGASWLMAEGSRCRPASGCRPPPLPPWPELIWDYMKWTAGAYSVSWPWHLAWLTYGGLGLWAGLRLRARRNGPAPPANP